MHPNAGPKQFSFRMRTALKAMSIQARLTAFLNAHMYGIQYSVNISLKYVNTKG